MKNRAGGGRGAFPRCALPCRPAPRRRLQPLWCWGGRALPRGPPPRRASAF